MTATTADTTDRKRITFFDPRLGDGQWDGRIRQAGKPAVFLVKEGANVVYIGKCKGGRLTVTIETAFKRCKWAAGWKVAIERLETPELMRDRFNVLERRYKKLQAKAAAAPRDEIQKPAPGAGPAGEAEPAPGAASTPTTAPRRGLLKSLLGAITLSD